MLLQIPGPPQSSRAIRALVIQGPPRFISVQVVGPGSVRIGPQQSEVENTVAGAGDGIEINSNQWPVFQAWWHGDLWIIAENATALVRVIIGTYQGGNQT